METILGHVEGLLDAGDTEEAKQHLASVWPFVSGSIDLPIENISSYAAMALACRRLNHMQHSNLYANIALISDPNDMLAHALQTPHEKTLLIRQLLHNQQTQKAIGLLNALENYSPTEDSAFYLRLLDFFKQQENLAITNTEVPHGQRPTLLNVTVWGKAYIEKLFRYSIPSLLAKGNIPALTEQGDVIVDIYTSEADRNLFEESPVMARLAQYTKLNYMIIPNEMLSFKKTDTTKDHDRFIVGGAQYTSVVRAKHLGADLFYVATDAIYSDDFMKGTKAYLKEGYSAVLTIMLRGKEQNIDAYLSEHADSQTDTISINTHKLLDYTTNNLNPEIFSNFIRSEPQYVSQDPTSLFFKTPRGFSSHSFQILLAMVSNELLPEKLAYDYHTQDGRLLAELANGQDPDTLFKLITNPREEFVAVDLDPGSEGLERGFGSFAVDTQTCAKSGTNWCVKESDFEYFEWAFKQRFELDCPSAVQTLPDSTLDEEEVVEAVLEEFRALKANTLKMTEIIQGKRFTGR